jgi:hypothetical protein
MVGVIDEASRRALLEVRADLLTYGQGYMRGDRHVPVAQVIAEPPAQFQRRLTAINRAIAPIMARMPRLTRRGFLRQSVAHSALVAGQRP